MGRMTGTWRKIGLTGSRGIALLIVLWGLVLLAVIAAAFTTETRTEVTLARNLVENAKAQALADAGVHRAILELLAPQTKGLITPEIENLMKLSRDSPAASRRTVERILRQELGPEADDRFRETWRTDGTFYGWRFGGGAARISIQDEAGKIDLNRAPDELIQGLFVAIGVEEAEAQARTAAITDFRDPDDLTHVGGAEDEDYRAAGLAYGPKNAPFEAVAELQQVLGMSREVYARAAPALTVHSRSKGVDVTKAPPDVLRALPGVDPAAIQAFSQRPEGQKGQARLAGARITTLPGLGRKYAARSQGQVFTIRAEATTQTGAVFVREAVVSLKGDRQRLFRILAWRRGKGRGITPAK